MCTALRRKEIFISSWNVHVRTYMVSVMVFINRNPFNLVRTLKASNLLHDVFFPIFQKFQHYKLYQAYHIFLFFLCPQRKTHSYGTYHYMQIPRYTANNYALVFHLFLLLKICYCEMASNGSKVFQIEATTRGVL